MSMFNDDSYNDGVNAGKRIAVGCIVASMVILGILLLTFSSNRAPKKEINNNTTLATVSADDSDEKSEYVPDDEKRTSDELSFWNMYDKDEDNTVISSNTQKNKSKKEELLKKLSEDAASKNKAEENTANKFNIAREGEDPEYVMISRSISRNEMDAEGFDRDENGRLTYSVNGKKASHFGIDVSLNNGNIDWGKVKADGVEFAMLKIGSRGYSTGNIILDDAFQKNFDGCSSNGIAIGAYFFSQATTREEAIEEANYCVIALNGRKIDYPVVFDCEAIANDSYRTENLTSSQLTDCALAFCETIAAYGYTPMIAATEERLVKKLNLVMLQRYGIWLFDTGESCDYPYRYAIRQYDNKGVISGIDSNVSLDICLISYSER